MQNRSTKIMRSCAKGECEENSTKLKLHSNKTNNSLQQQPKGNKKLVSKIVFQRHFKSIKLKINQKI